nr:MAG: protein B [Sichuan mountain noda-like virus 1]
MSSASEQIQRLPVILSTVVRAVEQSISDLPPCENANVVKDLANFRECLAGMSAKAARVTKAILSKPPVQEYLTGERSEVKRLNPLREIARLRAEVDKWEAVLIAGGATTDEPVTSIEEPTE